MMRALTFLICAAPALAQVVDSQRIDPPEHWGLGEKAQLGYAMAQEGETYLVSVPGRQGGAGSVLRYERVQTSGTWELVQEIQCKTPKAHTYFGISLGFEGSRAVVGSPYRSPGGLHYSGIAHVFERDANGDFVQVQALVPSNPGKDFYFGYASDVDGDTIVVASPLAGPNKEGILYVFERDPVSGKFLETQQLTANLPGTWPILGERVDLDGDVLVAGGGSFNVLSLTPAVVYRRAGPGAPFVEEQLLSAGSTPFTLPQDVSVDGDRILIGAREEIDGAGHEGRAFLFEYDPLATSWSLAQEFVPLDLVTEHFAFSVHLLGDRAMIGNYYHDLPTTQPGPLVQVAREDPVTGAWSLEAVGEPAPVGTEWLASEVLTTPFAGFAHRGFHSLPLPAYVYVFGFADGPLGAVGCPPVTPNSAGLEGRALGAGSSDVLANALALEAWDLPANVFGHLLIAADLGSGVTPPGSQGLLCLQGSIGRFAHDVKHTGADGRATTVVDLTALPLPGGPVAGMVGETWHFQFWYRDQNPTATSNLTESVELLLR